MAARASLWSSGCVRECDARATPSAAADGACPSRARRGPDPRRRNRRSGRRQSPSPPRAEVTSRIREAAGRCLAVHSESAPTGRQGASRRPRLPFRGRSRAGPTRTPCRARREMPPARRASANAVAPHDRPRVLGDRSVAVVEGHHHGVGRPVEPSCGGRRRVSSVRSPLLTDDQPVSYLERDESPGRTRTPAGHAVELIRTAFQVTTRKTASPSANHAANAKGVSMTSNTPKPLPSRASERPPLASVEST
jgi:hypothetical protein